MGPWLWLACSDPTPPGPSPAEVVAFAASGGAAGSVSLAGRGVTDAAFVAALSDPGFPPELHSLSANGNLLGAEAIAALDATDRCEALTWLNLTSNPLGDDGARALANSRCVSSLETLLIADAGVGPDGARALAQSGLPQLTQLVAGRQPLGAGATGLVALPALRRLELPGAAIDGPTARALIEGSTAGALSLDDNPLGPGGLVGLGPPSPALRSLTLVGCGLSAADAEALVAALGRADALGLVELDLTGNPLGDAGVRALAEAPWLTRLEKLRVERTEATLDVRKALVEAWGSRGGIKVERR